IMAGVDVDTLTMEQYLALSRENQAPCVVKPEIRGNVNFEIQSQFMCELREDTFSGNKDEDAHDHIDREEVEYMTDDEVVMSEQEESNHGYNQNIQHFEEKDDVDEWLNAKITKHMSLQGVENMKDALISIIKSIRQEMKDGIMKRQFEALTASVSDEVSSIDSNEVDRADDNTPNTTPCRLPKELRPGSFLLPFNINNHNLYATTTLDAKDNIMPQRVYKYLGPFLESTRAQIHVFNEEISFEIGSEKFKFNINSHQCIEKIYMVDIGQEEATFNPLEIGIDLFSYKSPACLKFEQRTRSYGTPNPQDKIAEPISFSPDRRGLVKRWHVCKPIHVTYDDGSGEDCRMWPTCDPDSKFCFGYNEIFEKIDDTTRERRYYAWIAQNYEFSKHRTFTSTNLNDHYPYNTNDPIPTPQGHREQGDDEPRPIRPRPCNYSFKEWLKIRIGHNNLHESDREFIFNEWILDSYDVEEEYAREIGNSYSRRFKEYNRVFNNEIEHLSNEYILRIRKKGYVLDDVWEKCQQNYKKTKPENTWHDEGFAGCEKSRSQEAIIETGLTHNHVRIKSLREDGDNLKDFCQISNLEAMLKEFLS
ncbi:hypothetical protein Tco_0713355, partial [Tanacetum coccineum]